MKIRDGFNFGIGLFLSSFLIFIIGLLLWFLVFFVITNDLDYSLKKANDNNSSSETTTDEELFEKYKKSDKYKY